MKAFITGSRAYGTHQKHSDLDLCVLMSEDLRVTLMQEFGWPIKIGILNLIPCTDEVEMLAWKRATEECCNHANTQGSLAKETAIAIHKAWRKSFKVEERDMGGSGATREEQEEIDSAKQEARERLPDGYFLGNGKYR